MIKELTEQLTHGNNLTIEQMTNVMNEILTGTQNDEDVAEFLKNLTQKGESDDELLAMLNKMEEFALHISPNCQGKVIDVCGTGGDKLKTFNISTAASFVIAAAGGNVAKHGNRSISGVSGSADIFEYFDPTLFLDTLGTRKRLNNHRRERSRDVSDPPKYIIGATYSNISEIDF